MDKFDLKKCLACFDEAYEARYGATHNMAALERRMRPLRNGRAISYEDIKALVDKGYWHYGQFISIPDRESLPLDKSANLLDQVVKNEREVLWEIFNIIKNVELMSLLLHFTYPEYYGIFSPLLISELQTPQERKYVDNYLKFNEILREKRDIYGFSRVADVDHAYWALVQKCKSGRKKDCPNFRAYTGYIQDYLDIGDNALYINQAFGEALQAYTHAHRIKTGDLRPLEGLFEVYRQLEDVLNLICTGLELLELYKEGKNWVKVIVRAEDLLSYDRIFEVLQDKITALKKMNRKEALIAAYDELKDFFKMEGQLKDAIDVCMDIDAILGFPSRAEERKNLLEIWNDISSKQVEGIKKIKVCINCESIARKARCSFELLPKEAENDCDLCERGYGGSPILKGKNLGLVGGREGFRGRYIEALTKRFRLKEVIFHNAIYHLEKIEGVVKGSDFIVICTGSAKHSGTLKAERECQIIGKKYIRVHEVGVNSLIQGISEYLAPQFV